VKDIIYSSWFAVCKDSPNLVKLAAAMFQEAVGQYPGAVVLPQTLQVKPPQEIAGSLIYPQGRGELVLIRGSVRHRGRSVRVFATCVVVPDHRRWVASRIQCRARRLGEDRLRIFRANGANRPLWIPISA
jgi:hypothetical protein